jgi:hypothetical protein
MVSMKVSNCGRYELILRLKRSEYALEYLHIFFGNSYLEYALTEYCKQYTSPLHLFTLAFRYVR